MRICIHIIENSTKRYISVIIWIPTNNLSLGVFLFFFLGKVFSVLLQNISILRLRIWTSNSKNIHCRYLNRTRVYLFFIFWFSTRAEWYLMFDSFHSYTYRFIIFVRKNSKFQRCGLSLIFRTFFREIFSIVT